MNMNVLFYVGAIIVVVFTFIFSWHNYHPSLKEACLQAGGTSVEHRGQFERCIL